MGVRSVIKHNWRPPPLTRDDYRAVNESRMARCSGGGRELMRSRDRFPEYKLLPSSCFHLLPRSNGQADARASAGFYTHVEESHGPVQECQIELHMIHTIKCLYINLASLASKRFLICLQSIFCFFSFLLPCGFVLSSEMLTKSFLFIILKERRNGNTVNRTRVC